MSDLPNSHSSFVKEAQPKHIAVIMDGNGRWGIEQKNSRIHGLKAGFETVKKVITASRKVELDSLTLFAFSTENWSRPQKEVDFIMKLLLKALEKESAKMMSNDIKLTVIGDKSRFSRVMQKKIQEVEELTQHCKGLNLNLAINYGGRWDILEAAKQLARDALENKIDIAGVEENDLNARMSLAEQAPVDLMIRTSGEYRISNFVLWQAAYAELYFSDLCWPEFSEQDFYAAIEWFSTRQRRFGLTGEQIVS